MLYDQEAAQGGAPCILCESGVVPLLGGRDCLDLGREGEEMAQRLYALLRTAEARVTLLIGIEPKERGGVMAGVLNRFTRAFGGTHET